MSLSEEERNAIIAYRVDKALQTLNEALGISSLGYWNAVANRLYELRQSGDYDDLFHLEKEDVLPLIQPAENYINELKALLI